MINFKGLFQNMFKKEMRNSKDVSLKQFQINSAKADILL